MASSPGAAIDPRRPGQYTLKIGKGLKSGSGSASTSYSRVKLNHKPNLSNGTRSSKLSRNDDGTASLAIKDQESDGKTSRYSYKGSHKTSKNAYVLIFDPETQACTLEPAQSAYNFNLTSTPWETSKEKLARQYEQLTLEEERRDNANLDQDPDEEPDKDNPYDFRHYLNVNSKPSPSPSPALKPSSTVHTPSLGSSRPATTSTGAKAQSRPASKVDPLRQAPRKQKPAANESSKPASKPTPTVRLDRRASTRPGEQEQKKAMKPVSKPAAKSNAKSDYYVHSSDEDDTPPEDTSKAIDAEESGGLEIDWGNEKPKPKKSLARALDLPDTSGDGPISLHSAANSPAGRMAPIPRKQKQRPEYEADVIDLGTSDAYVSDDSPPPANDRDEDTQMRDADVESDGDDDVEPMILGSPAHHQPPQQVIDEVMETAPEDEVDYDDDDLEAEMMAAMADEDVAEESEESEAE